MSNVVIMLIKLIRWISNILNVFPIDSTKVYFRCFDGNRYGFDQRAILEYIFDKHTDEFKIVWEIDKKSNISIPKGIKTVKKQSLKQIFNIKNAKFIIYNIDLPQYVNYRKEQVLINTWHGFGIKGNSAEQINMREKFNQATYFLSCADFYESTVLKGLFAYRGKIIRCGSPRNDVFFSEKKNDWALKVREYYHVPVETKILLYAPTFRKNFMYKDMKLEYGKIIDTLKSKFSGDWIIFERKHPMIKQNQLPCKSNVIDVSSYEDIQELLCAADILISDYSGCMWDFTFTTNPIFMYAPDLDKYKDDRGIFIDVDKLPYPIAHNNDELIEVIMRFNYVNYQRDVSDFYNYVGNRENGIACQIIDDILHDKVEAQCYIH